MQVVTYWTSNDHGQGWSMNRQTAIGLLGAILAFAVHWTGGVAYVVVEGSKFEVELSPHAALAFPFLLFVAVTSWRTSSEDDYYSDARWYRVFVALVVDLLLYSFVAAVPLCLVSLAHESGATSSFAWSFSRDYSRQTDLVVESLYVATGLLLVFSMGISSWKSRRTPGGLLTGISIVPNRPASFLRCAFLGWFWYLYLAIPPFLRIAWSHDALAIVVVPDNTAASS